MRAANQWYTVQTLLVTLLAGCSNVLDVHPVNETDASQAITIPAVLALRWRDCDASGARRGVLRR
jgi:hypothetical protein